MSVPASTMSSQVLNDEHLNEFLTASRCGVAIERRAAERHSFFAPVSIRPCAAPEQRWSAFSRDICCDGIGLLHNMAIARGTVCELTLKSDCTELRHEAECMWCTSAGEGWYLSGWRFVPSHA